MKKDFIELTNESNDKLDKIKKFLKIKNKSLTINYLAEFFYELKKEEIEEK